MIRLVCIRTVCLLLLLTGLLRANALLAVQIERTSSGEMTAGVPFELRAVQPAGAANDLRFRWKVRIPGSYRFSLVREFTPDPTLRYTPMSGDGEYEVELVVLDPATGRTHSIFQSFSLLPLAKGDQPVVTPTDHALVFLYGTPPCPTGSELQIRVQSVSEVQVGTDLPTVSCDGKAVYRYLAGLRPESEYSVVSTVVGNGNQTASAALHFRTGPVPFDTAPVGVDALRGSTGVLFQNRLLQPSVALDNTGAVVWYYETVTPYLVRPQAGGYWWALYTHPNTPIWGQTMRRVDLGGNIVQETNAEYLSSQLVARGMRRITSLHHDAQPLPDGRVAVLAGVEQMPDDGKGGQRGVMGDMVLVLSEDLQIVWAWDAFDHLDSKREVIPDELCAPGGGGGCPTSFLEGPTLDWTHANSIALTPDGHLIVSLRHQDWVVKIDYAHGYGSGQVLWRLGRDGDFQLLDGTADDWFSHQHDAHFVEIDGKQLLLVFDNGNTREFRRPGNQSRGQLFELDENARTAKLVLNANLGAYSFALGSAQLLPNGNFWFENGIKPNFTADGVEISPTGQTVRTITTGTPVYRSLWLKDLYRP